MNHIKKFILYKYILYKYMNYISIGIQIFHTIVTILCVLFPYFYPKYDLYYTIYVFLASLHWFFLKGECFLTYLEKITLDKSYKLGDDPYLNPFYKIIGTSTMNLVRSLHIINFIYILYRNYSTSNFYPILILIILIIGLQNLVEYIYPKKYYLSNTSPYS
jgi:hypothetical protein